MMPNVFRDAIYNKYHKSKIANCSYRLLQIPYLLGKTVTQPSRPQVPTKHPLFFLPLPSPEGVNTILLPLVLFSAAKLPPDPETSAGIFATKANDMIMRVNCIV